MSSHPQPGPPFMDIAFVLAGAVVSDDAAAEPWYTTLLGRGPDARPMTGLLEWRLDGRSGLQVWRDPERAGRSSVVLGVDDLDAAASRLAGRGIVTAGPEPGGAARILRLQDPDGNSVVLLGDQLTPAGPTASASAHRPDPRGA